jgi:hypothetical protein
MKELTRTKFTLQNANQNGSGIDGNTAAANAAALLKSYAQSLQYSIHEWSADARFR